MKLKPDFVLAPVADEFLLVPTRPELKRQHGLFRLNETAEFIVSRLRTETTVDAIVDALLAEYDVQRPDAEKSVLEIVEKLRKIGAIAE